MMFSKPYHILHIMKKFLIPFMKDEKETFYVMSYEWCCIILLAIVYLQIFMNQTPGTTLVRHQVKLEKHHSQRHYWFS